MRSSSLNPGLYLYFVGDWEGDWESCVSGIVLMGEDIWVEAAERVGDGDEG